MYRWLVYTLSVLLISLCGLGCVKQSSPGVRKAPEKPQQDASTTPVASNKQAPNTPPPPQQRTTKTAQAPDKKTVHKKVATKPTQRRPAPPDKLVQKAPVLLTFRASSLEPYFSERRYRRLRSALRWNCKKADSILKKKDAFPERLTGAAIFLLARCYQRRRKYDEARKRYALLHKMNYVLRDYLYFWEAETWEKQRKYDKANALFLKVSKRSRYFRWSRLRVVGNLFKKKKYDELIKVLRRNGYHKRRDATFWLWMARAHLKKKTKEDDKQAKVWLKKIWIEKPASGEAYWVKRARWRKRTRFTLNTQEKLRRAYRYNYIYAYKQAIRATWSIKKKQLTDATLRCRYHYARGFAWFRRRIYYRAVKELLQARTHCVKRPYEHVRILYRLGQAFKRRGMAKKGVPYLDELVKLYPKHFLADDALYMTAYALERRKTLPAAKKRYRQLQQQYPGGEMAVMSRWRLAYKAYKHRQYDEALPQLLSIQKDHPESRHAPAALYFAGRIWHKRIWQKRKRNQQAKDSAIAMYTRLIKQYPLQYYSFMALSRVRRLKRRRWHVQRVKRKRRRRKKRSKRRKRRRYKRLVLPWGPVPRKIIASKDLPTQFDGVKASFLAHPHYKRGLELYRLGMEDLAALEWRRLRNCKVFPPSENNKSFQKRRRRCGLFGDKGAALLSLHFHVAEVYHRADHIFRHRGELAGTLPFNPSTHKYWYLAYPKPFWDEVEKAHKKNQEVPLSLIYGMMKEESTFDPDIQSWAKAYGLMQLLLPTAQTVAKEVFPGKKIEPAHLTRPEINVPLGVRYLRNRVEQFAQQLPVAIGSYNAGPKLMKKFVQSYGYLPLDEWVESISIRQTRRYIKRVLQSHAIYHFLYGVDGKKNGALVAFKPSLRLRTLFAARNTKK